MAKGGLMSERIPGSQSQGVSQLLDTKFPTMSSFNWEVALALLVLDVDEMHHLGFCNWLEFDHVTHVAQVYTSGGRAGVKTYIEILIREYFSQLTPAISAPAVC